MKSLILAVAMMIMPFMVNAHRGDDRQATCHKNEEGVFHCHVLEADKKAR